MRVLTRRDKISTARQGTARHGTAGQGRGLRGAVVSKPSHPLTVAGAGAAWLGWAGHGVTGCGGIKTTAPTHRGRAGRGMARHGRARQGLPGAVVSKPPHPLTTAWRGTARRGRAGRGRGYRVRWCQNHRTHSKTKTKGHNVIRTDHPQDPRDPRTTRIKTSCRRRPHDRNIQTTPRMAGFDGLSDGRKMC